MSELLQCAIDVLKIRDVYLRSSKSTLSEDFEPKYHPEDDGVKTLTKHIVKKSSVLVLEVDDEEPTHLFRVYIELGALWLNAVTDELDGDGQVVNQDNLLAEIEAVLVAEYHMIEDPGEDALNIFALSNASFHVWPFWREYLSMQCLRMNLPKFVVPAVQFAQNGKDG